MLPAARLRNTASVLIVALWAISLLTVFAVILSSKVKQQLAVALRLEERGKLRFICEAGVKKAIMQIRKSFNNSCDTFKDQALNNEAAFRDQRLGGAILNVCYNTDNEQPPLVLFGAIDEQGKININKSEEEVLRRLFRLALGSGEMKAQELAASIVDWRDPDNQLSIPLGSAESPYYNNLEFSYAAKDNAFDILEEVLLVKGMSEDDFTKIKNYITIYGNGKVNINTASRKVLLSLGLKEDIVEDILVFRSGKDGVTGTPDDLVFNEFSEIVPKLSAAFRFSDSQIAHLSNIAGRFFTVKSNAFMIRSVARLASGKHESCVVCVVDRSGKILYWREL